MGLREKWAALSRGKKWAVGISAFLVISAIAALDKQSQPLPADPNMIIGGGSNDCANGCLPAQPGMPGDQAYGGAPYSGQPQPGYGGGVAPAAQDSGPSAYQQAFEAQQRSQDQRSQAFGEMIRDQTTIQDNQTGQVYTGVDNSIANPAMESGSYSAVPTSELPVSGDQ